MLFSKICLKLSKKIILPMFIVFSLVYSIAILLSGYEINIIANSELISYKLFFSNPSNILDTYHHWLPNLIGALIIKFTGQYSISALRFCGFIVILISCYISYRLLLVFFDRKLSILGTLFSLVFILKNYTIFNSALFTGFIYMIFIYFVVQAVNQNKDYLFFFAGILLSLNFFADCQNILCILNIFGIFIFYKIAKIPNSKQNKQFISLLSGLFLSSIIILLIMSISGELDYYLNSVNNYYEFFEHSIGIYSDLNLLKTLKVLTFYYLYWPIFILVILFITGKFLNFKNKGYFFILSIIIISSLLSYLVKNNWEYIFIGISFGILILYIFNILKSNTEFKLMCILALLAQSLLGIGILRDNNTIIYGIGIGLPMSFIIGAKLVLNNFNMKINIYKKESVKFFNIKSEIFSFILISLFLVYILCSAKSVVNKSSLLLSDNSSILSNQNFINIQIKSQKNDTGINKITECIKKYSYSSDYLLTQNDINILYFTTGKKPLLSYTIYDEDTVPFDIQIENNIKKINAFPIVVLKKELNNALFYNSATNFVNKNKYKSVYKSNTYEVFIPVTN